MNVPTQTQFDERLLKLTIICLDIVFLGFEPTIKSSYHRNNKNNYS